MLEIVCGDSDSRRVKSLHLVTVICCHAFSLTVQDIGVHINTLTPSDVFIPDPWLQSKQS